MQTIIVTGSAGFVGWKTSKLLLERGYGVLGIDDLNEYYDIKLKYYRLKELKKNKDFAFIYLDWMYQL